MTNSGLNASAAGTRDFPKPADSRVAFTRFHQHVIVNPSPAPLPHSGRATGSRAVRILVGTKNSTDGSVSQNHAASRCRGAHPTDRSGRVADQRCCTYRAASRPLLRRQKPWPASFGMVRLEDAPYKAAAPPDRPESHPLQPVPHRRQIGSRQGAGRHARIAGDTVTARGLPRERAT